MSREDEVIRIPTRDDEVLRIVGESFNPQEVAEALEPLGLEVFISPHWSLVASEVQKLLLEHGVSYLWRLSRVRESVLPPGPPAHRPALVKVLADMLVRSAPTASLTIVDRFLFSGDPDEFVADIRMALDGILATLPELRLVTKPLKDMIALDKLRSALRADAPHCVLRHFGSDRYHDRFWIADEQRGLLVGTSLNGLGRRYSIVDYLDDADLNDLVADLRQHVIS